MNIGERIRRIRTKRGMTQKELGIALGFPERSADVRIAQYEAGTRKPKEDLVEAIAHILRVRPSAISAVDSESYIGLMYTLFDLEDSYGLHIDKINDELCIRLDRDSKSFLQLSDMLEEWYAAWNQDQDDPSSLDRYSDWKLNYPPFEK